MFRVPPEIASRKANYDHPNGSAWLVSGEEVGLDTTHPFLVRQLRRGDSMLRISSVLGHAAALELPNLKPVTYWSRSDGATWIGTELGFIGSPLAEHDDRMDWGQATEIWRPLVFAIQSAHKRGIIHGALHPWSVFLDTDANRLVAIDGATWIGDEVVTGVWGGEPSIHQDVANLARLLLWLFHPLNAREPEPNMEGVPAYASSALLRALDVSNTATTSDLIAALAPAPLRGIPSNAGKAQDTETILYGRVHGVEHVQHERMGAGVKFWITHPAYDDQGAAQGYSPPRGAFFYESAHGEVYASVKDVWDGAELNLIDARTIQDSTGQTFLTAHPQTLPVLEPHWPVPVTNVLKAHGCVSRYFVDVRDSGPPSRPLVLGNLVHGVLEDLDDADNPTDFDSIWERRIPRLRIAMLAAGMTDDQLPKLKSDAAQHYQGILAFARNRAQTGDRVGWSGENVEVSRYSSIYGLEGRIDLVTQDENTGLHIVELKSGSVRDEHLSQVRCYKLLWDDIAKRRSLSVNGYLLYSRDARLQTTPLEDPLRERRLLRARNALVAAHHTLAFSDEPAQPYFMEVPRQCNGPDCRFRKDRCAVQNKALGLNPTLPRPELAAYWQHFSRLLEIENWVEHERIGAMLQSGRLRERVQSHRAASGLEVHGVDIARGEVTFTGLRDRGFHMGDIVVAHRGDFHSDHILRGTIRMAEADRLVLGTQAAAVAETLPKSGWIVDKLTLRIGYRSSQQALYRAVKGADATLTSILLRPGSTETEVAMTGDRATKLSARATSSLNDAQLEAVATAVSSPRACLVQGPPGTGKTTVIAHTVLELVAQGKRVLLAAQTHTAVDTMLARVLELEHQPILRVGSRRKSPRLTQMLEQFGLNPRGVFTDDLSVDATDLAALAESMRSAPIVGCTTHAAARSDVLDVLSRDLFDVVIIDEATQITEPMTLAPMMRAKRFVLVGDHLQLPPIVQSELANSLIVDGWRFDEPNLPQLGLFEPAVEDDGPGLRGLDQSLFQRLAESGAPYVMLTEQYRMNAKIMAFSNHQYYAGRLTSAALAANRQLTFESDPDGQWSEILGPDNPVVFVDVDGESTDGRTNTQEAELCAACVQELRRTSPESTLGVVSPFRAQVHAISKLVTDTTGVDVDTVERYQGSERDVIVVSLVKTSNAGEFLADPRRLNVTLTRARAKLIIFGNRSCLEADPMFRDLIQQPETHNVRWEP